MGRTALFLSLFYLFSPALAEEPKSLMGFGANSCALYRQNVQAKEDMRMIYFSWAEGWMSGMNGAFLQARLFTDFGKIILEDMMANIDKICEKYPDESYTHAVVGLYDELRKMQGLPDWRTLTKQSF